MRRIAILVVALFVGQAHGARAQDLRPLSLADAQVEARAHAPEGAELSARLRGAELVVSTAGRVVRTNPALSATYVPGSLVPDRDEQSWSLGVSQTFDVSGSWGPRGEAARAERDRVAYDGQEGLRALDEAVAVAVADVALAQRRVTRTSRIVRLQAIAMEAARKQLEVGQGNQLDVDAADLDLAGVRSYAALAEGALMAARVQFARLLGRSSPSTLAVEDPLEDGAIAAAPALRVEETSRVQAAQAGLRAAELELRTERRMIWPDVTLRLTYDDLRQNVPLGAFRGPAASGLSATWGDREIGIGVEVPLPIFYQRPSERAQATGRLLAADARARVVAADVRRDLDVTHALLEANARAFREVAGTPQILEREFELLDKAVRSGAVDAVARAVAIRRLQEAGARYDDTVRELRVARARWRRVGAREAGAR